MAVLVSLPTAEDIARLLPLVPSLGDEMHRFMTQLTAAVKAGVASVENSGNASEIVIRIYKPKDTNTDSDFTNPLGKHNG